MVLLADINVLNLVIAVTWRERVRLGRAISAELANYVMFLLDGIWKRWIQNYFVAYSDFSELNISLNYRPGRPLVCSLSTAVLKRFTELVR